jgi:hypothetical protein
VVSLLSNDITGYCGGQFIVNDITGYCGGQFIVNDITGYCGGQFYWCNIKRKPPTHRPEVTENSTP